MCVCVCVCLSHCYVTWHVLNFGCPIHISGVAEARALKLCIKGDYIKSGQRDDKSPLKGAWFCSRDPFFVCTAVELERNLHCTRWFAINRRSLPGYYTWWAVQYGWFLPRDAMLSVVHAIVMCLSVRLSVFVCVCLLHSCIVWKWLKVGSRRQR